MKPETPRPTEFLSDKDKSPGVTNGGDALDLGVYSGNDTADTNGYPAQKNYNTFEVEENGDIEKSFDGGGGGGNNIDTTFTMQDALDYIGFGPYQVLLSFYFGLAYMADSMEVMLVSVLVPVLKCVFREVGSFERALLPVVAFLGLLISGSYWGKVGDKYGRKSMLIMSNLMCGYFGVLSAFSPTYWWIIINRLLVSFSLGGFPQMMSYYAEFLPTKSRSTCVVFLALIWAMGACLEIIFAMVTLPSLRWRLFLVISALPIILFTFLAKFIPESPRHLLAHGRYDEAIAILNRVAKMNRKKLPEGRLYQPYDEVLDKNKLADIFIPTYLKTTLLLGLATGTVAVAYFGTAFLTTMLFDKRDGCHGYERGGSSSDQGEGCLVYCPTLTISDYVDLLLTSLGDAPGVLVCILLMARFSRKASLGFQMAVYTLAVLAINFCAPRKILVGLFFLARAMADGAGQGVMLYITEVYPTSVRAIGMGWCVSAKGMGAMLSVLSSNIFLEYSSFLAISSLALAGFVCTVCFVLLPYETRDKRMLDTLQEKPT